MKLCTRQTGRLSLLALGLILLVAGTVLAQARNTEIGKWKLNLAKSTYEPGPRPTSEMRVLEVWDKDGVKAATTTVGLDGKPATRSYTAHYDGKINTYLGTPDYDTIALTRIDANTTRAINKKGTKVVLTSDIVVSSDGKTRTITMIGVNLKGQKVHNVSVSDRQ